VHPTQIEQQPVMELAHLLALALQSRPSVLGLSADLLGELCVPVLAPFASRG
jgi:hypothetical protein